MRALEEKGWEIHPQVGVSFFRVDLGVVHPDFPGRYLAGVECDGATYHRSATARDRDRLRELVLTGLGWKIRRIWSTEWWMDAASAAEKIHARLNVDLAADRASRPPPEQKVDAAAAQGEEPFASSSEEEVVELPSFTPAEILADERPAGEVSVTTKEIDAIEEVTRVYARGPEPVEATREAPTNRSLMRRPTRALSSSRSATISTTSAIGGSSAGW